MSDPVSLAELEKQHVELLPARTVLSTLTTPGDSDTSTPSLGSTAMSLLGINQGGNGADGTATDGNTGADKE